MSQSEAYIKYGGYLRKRFRQQEKIRFLGYLQEDFKANGFEMSLDARTFGKQRIVNAVFGDLESAKNIVVTYYDTPFRSFGLFEYKPFQPDADRVRKAIAMKGISGLSMLLVLGLLGIGILSVFTDGHLDGMDVLLGLLITVFALIAYRTVRGVANPYNIAMNTSSILAMLQASDATQQTAYCFVDYGAVNGMGVTHLLEKIKGRDSDYTLLILDSVGAAESLYALSNVGFIPNDIHALNKALPRYLEPVQKCICLASGTIQNDELTVAQAMRPTDTQCVTENCKRVSTFIEALDHEAL